MVGGNAADPPDRSGERVGGKYDLLERIAVGGMGEVYRARNAMIGREVALKILLPSLALHEEVRARFLHEAKLAHFVRHAHVVEMLDIDADALGIPFIVQEFLAGEDLGEHLGQVGRMPFDVALAVLQPVAMALGAAHRKGVVHRDLKPENIFLHNTEDLVVPKILDFGISKGVVDDNDPTVTRSGLVMGSPAYMSPEQIRFPDTVDESTDVWALGVILYEVLTGRLPFDHEDVRELFLLICRDDPEPVTDHAPDLPRGLSDLVSRCLQRDRTKRPKNGAEVASAIAAVMGRMSGARGLTRDGARIDAYSTPFDAFQDAIGVRASALSERPPDRPRAAQTTQHSEWGAWELPEELALDLEADLDLSPHEPSIPPPAARPRVSVPDPSLDLDAPLTEHMVGLDIDYAAAQAAADANARRSMPTPTGQVRSAEFSPSALTSASARNSGRHSMPDPVSARGRPAMIHVEPVLPSALNMMLSLCLIGAVGWLVPTLAGETLPEFTRQLGPFLYLGALAVVAALGVTGFSVFQRAREDDAPSLVLAGVAALVLTATVLLDALRHLLPNLPGVIAIRQVVGFAGFAAVAMLTLGFGLRALTAAVDARRLKAPRGGLSAFFGLVGVGLLGVCFLFGYLCYQRFV